MPTDARQFFCECLQDIASAQVRRLLRVLLLGVGSVSMDPGIQIRMLHDDLKSTSSRGAKPP